MINGPVPTREYARHSSLTLSHWGHRWIDLEVCEAWLVWCQTFSVTATPWPVPNYTAWWQKYMHVNNLPRAVTWQQTNWESYPQLLLKIRCPKFQLLCHQATRELTAIKINIFQKFQGSGHRNYSPAACFIFTAISVCLNIAKSSAKGIGSQPQSSSTTRLFKIFLLLFIYFSIFCLWYKWQTKPSVHFPVSEYTLCIYWYEWCSYEWSIIWSHKHL